jgi:hypothetical protein
MTLLLSEHLAKKKSTLEAFESDYDWIESLEVVVDADAERPTQIEEQRTPSEIRLRSITYYS